MHTKLNKFVSSPEARLRFKKQCLKNKNILFENDSLQIGCKMLSFYDFYTSKNYLQMQIFIGNKSPRKIQGFTIHYRGTPNLELYIEQKNKSIAQNTQFKEKVMINCLNYEQEILLLLDLQSQVLTLKSIPIPVSLFSFCSILPQNACSLPLTSSYPQLSDLLSSRYEYIEEQQVVANVGIFKKGLLKDIPKYFCELTPHMDNMLVGEFTLRDLNQLYVLTILIKDEMKMKISLCSNNYAHFDAILSNLNFLLSA